MSAAAVLVVESDPAVLERTSVVLKASGFGVTAARDPAQATDQLRHRAFDAVVADLPIGHDDSWRAVDELRSLAPAGVLGLLTTSVVSETELAQHKVAFALVKPASSEQLLDALGQCLALPDVTSDVKSAIWAYYAALERSDWDRLVALCTPEVVYQLPADDLRIRGVIAGRSALRAFAEDTFAKFPGPRFLVRSIRPLPDGVLVHYDGTWRTDHGRSDPLPGSILFRFEGKLIAEIGVRVDLRATDRRI